MSDQSSTFDLIRQLREMGAVEISVGDVCVRFTEAPTIPSFTTSRENHPMETWEPPEPILDSQSEDEDVQYWSSRG